MLAGNISEEVRRANSEVGPYNFRRSTQVPNSKLRAEVEGGLTGE
jgi:hypothetical protein